MYEQISFGDYNEKPLAERMRPICFEDFLGQDIAIGINSMLRKAIETDTLSSIILWGPPGCGKTTLVSIIARYTKSKLYSISAVTSGVKEIKNIIDISRQNNKMAIKTILFIDEIHRLNKAQQDVLLSDVEKGNIILIGATTENPSFEINKALLSRTQVIVFHTLSTDNICSILYRAIKKDVILSHKKIKIEKRAIEKIAEFSGGDARIALNFLDALIKYFSINGKEEFNITETDVDKSFFENVMFYDKRGDEHYNIISALHKSMRNSDPDAAVYWLARMLEAGEDPLYIARRLIRFSSEDIGLANNMALQIAISTYHAVHFIGMPECSVNLAHAVIYLSVAPKSNSLYRAYEDAKIDAIRTKHIEVPLHLRNPSTKLMKSLHYGDNYKYAHDHKEMVTDMKCLPEELKDKVYYFPKDSGNESNIKKHLEQIKAFKQKPL